MDVNVKRLERVDEASFRRMSAPVYDDIDRTSPHWKRTINPLGETWKESGSE